MNDDLYGYELNEGEKTVFAQNTYGLPTLALLTILASYYGYLVLQFGFGAARSISKAVGPFEIINAVLAVVLMGIGVKLFYSETLKWWRRKPAIVTTQRILLPNGYQMPLERITKVESRFGTAVLTGRKLADGMKVHGLPNSKSFCIAKERQLA